jgi:hypothetical protein
MKFTTATALTAVLAFISGLFLPWWGIAVAALLVAVLIHQKPGKAFLAGSAGVILLWIGLAVWRDVTVLPLGGNPILLIVLTAFIGGLVAGLAALTGSYLRSSPKS